MISDTTTVKNKWTPCIVGSHSELTSMVMRIFCAKYCPRKSGDVKQTDRHGRLVTAVVEVQKDVITENEGCKKSRNK